MIYWFGMKGNKLGRWIYLVGAGYLLTGLIVYFVFVDQFLTDKSCQGSKCLPYIVLWPYLLGNVCQFDYSSMNNLGKGIYNLACLR